VLDIGTELAKRYRIDSWLGRGPLGNIYLAEDLEQHRLVAVKELRPDLAANPTFMWGLRHEAQVLNQTPEPESLRPEGVVEADQGAYVLVNYEPGMGLQELEERWPRTNYFARSWDSAPASATDEDALAARPVVDPEAPAAGLAEAGEGSATGASSVAAAGPVSEVKEASRVSADGPGTTAENGPASAGTNPPGDAGESAPVGVESGRAASQNYVPPAPSSERPSLGERGSRVTVNGAPEASDPGPAGLPARAAWPMPSSTTIGVLLLTVLVIALVIAAWLRGPGLLVQDPSVRAAPGVLAAGTATGRLSASATPMATGAPEVALLPSGSSSAAPGPTLARPAAGAAPTQPPPAIATQPPQASPTPTPASAYALIQAPANLRQGPGPNYAVLTVLQPGDQAAITGQSQDRSWWQVRTADAQTGWLFASLVTAQGQVNQVPVVPSPNTAAAAATPAPAHGIPTATQNPTDTPAPTPTSSATASAVLGACPRAPAGPFARLPAGQDRLGCPSSGLSSTDFAHQEFEHGQMLYRHDLRTIYVLYIDGTWSAFHDNYVEGEPFQLQQFNPPDGLKQPIKGFDRIWEQPAVRARLGWGTRDEASVIQGQAQAFERGQAMWVNRPGNLTAYFLLFADGTWAEYK
jgi:uncharacterized protein YraI